jgi:hypothetical protein
VAVTCPSDALGGLRDKLAELVLDSQWLTSCTAFGLLLGAADSHTQLATGAIDLDLPWLAADRAVLDVGAGGFGIDVELDALVAVRTANVDRLLHPATVAPPRRFAEVTCHP